MVSHGKNTYGRGCDLEVEKMQFGARNYKNKS